MPIETSTPPPIPSPYLTIKEAAVYFRCSRHQVSHWIHTEGLLAYQVGRQFLIRQDELDAWMQARQVHRPVLPAVGSRAGAKVMTPKPRIPDVSKLSPDDFGRLLRTMAPQRR